MITDHSNYKLKLMVSVYDREFRNAKENRIEAEYYLETHGVSIEDGQVRLLEGKPLTYDALSGLRKYLIAKVKREENESQLHGNLPAGVLRIDTRPKSHNVVWRVPPRLRKIVMGNTKAEVWPPELVFSAHKRQELRVFAIHENLLYSAPLPNLDGNGVMCNGDIALDQVRSAKTFEQYCSAWEAAFFNTRFSHDIDYEDYGEAYRIAAEQKAFPIKFLKPSTHNLDSI